MADDWTVDPTTGRSKSSPLFERLVQEVSRIVANTRLGDHPNTCARVIMAQLAHVHGLAPVPPSNGQTPT